MSDHEGAGGARVELRVLSNRGAKLVIQTFRNAEAIFQDAVDPTASGARNRYVRQLKAARPDITDDDLVEVGAYLLSLGMQRSAVQAPKALTPAPTSRGALVQRRDDQAAKILEETDPSVVSAAEAMLLAPDLVRQVINDAEALGVVGEPDLALLVYLVGTSRLLERPLSAIVQGPTSSGKSFVVETVARLFPSEAVLAATDLTPNSLYYLPDDALVHRFVVAGERRRGDQDDHAEATRALREMLSSGALRKVTPEKVGDRFETRIIEKHGPISFVETTSLPLIFDEDANRALLLATDERPEQTQRVMIARAQRAAGGGGTDVESILARHHAAQRLLRRVRVRVPFAVQIAERMPADRPEARRAYELALAVVSAVALLHQRQRRDGLSHGGVIDAEPGDYWLAWRLLRDPLGRALGGDVSAAAVRFGARLWQASGSAEMTAEQAAATDSTVKSPSKARAYLRELEAGSFTEIVEEARGSRPHVFRLLREPTSAGATWLPDPDEIDGDAPSGESDDPPSPYPPPGSLVQQSPQAQQSTPRAQESEAVSVPSRSVQRGATSAAGPLSLRRTDAHRHGRSDEEGTSCPTDAESRRSGIAAPTHRGGATERDVLAHFDGAERVDDPALDLGVSPNGRGR